MKYFALLLMLVLFSSCKTEETPDIPIILSEFLPGNWILESQETGFTLSERIIIMDNGIYLDFTNFDDMVLPSFWEERNNILVISSIGHPSPVLERFFHLKDKDTLVITYTDGLTGTYIRSNESIPNPILLPELMGEWTLFHMSNSPYEEEFPWHITFHPNGSGDIFEQEEVRHFTWGVIPANSNVLIMNFGNGEEYSLFSFIGDNFDFIGMPRNGTNIIYQRTTESPQESESYETEERFSEAHFNLRYEFEQFYIPLIIFGFESEIIDNLNNADTDAFFEHIIYWWRIATGEVVLAVWEGMGFDIPDTEEEQFELANELRPAVNLGDEHIADIMFFELDERTNAFVIEMLDMNFRRLSTYVGIAYNEEKGLNIFTLEQIEFFDAHMFCFIGIDSRGSFFDIDNTIEAFTETMLEAMNGLISPTAVLERDLY